MKKVIPFSAIFLLMCSLSSLSPQQDQEKTTDKKRRLTFSEIQEQARIFYNLDGEHKKPGWKQYKRWEWLAQSRLDKQGYFNPALHWQRWLEKRSRFPKDTASDLADWQPLGPNKKSQRVNNYSIYGLGRLNCVAFDPRDYNIIWVGAPSGGLWKSEDGGKTWTTNTDQLPNIGISDILIHPHNPDIMYIALGDRDAGHSLSVGIMKSVDGGQTWKMTGLNPHISEMMRISQLVMHPDDPETIFAATSYGIYKSTDGGQNWDQKIIGHFGSILVSPVDSSLWYASRWGRGIFLSSDSGETWTQQTEGLPTTGFSRINLAISPSDPQIIYAAYAQDGNDYYTGFGFFGLYRSQDSGRTWSLQSNTPNVFGANTHETYPNPYSLGHYAQVLVVAPENPNIIYSGSVNLWKSENGGRTWRYLTNFYGTGNAAEVHVDHHDLLFLPGSTKTMFLCNDGGLFRSDDAGWNWTDLSPGLSIRQIYRFGLSPHNPDHFILGSHDNGSDYFQGEWLNVMTGDGMECFIDPHDPNIIYVSYQNATLFRSINAGRSMVAIASDKRGTGCWVTPFVMDPIDSSTLYIGIDQVLKSTNRGDTWLSISPTLTGRDLSIIAVSPSNPFCMMVTDGQDAHRTLDGGQNWEELHHTQTAEIITDIAYHPRDPEIVYLTMGGYGEWFGHEGWRFGDYNFSPQKVLRSQDGGSTWTDITGDIPEMPVTCIAIDPHSSAVYVGTDLGVFYSPDGRGSWRLFEKGLPNVVVTELEISAHANWIWASTFGRGLWRSPLATKPVEAVVKPPLYFRGIKQEDNSLFQRRYFHILEWEANPANGSGNISGYRIYRWENGSRVLLAELDSGTREFQQVLAESQPLSYKLTAIDHNQNESAALSVTLR